MKKTKRISHLIYITVWLLAFISIIGCQAQEAASSLPPAQQPARTENSDIRSPDHTVEPAPAEKSSAADKEDKQDRQKANQPAKVQADALPAPAQNEDSVSLTSPAAVVEPPLVQSNEEQAKQEHTISMSITGDADTGIILEETTVSLLEGDTVFDVLKRLTQKKDIQMEYKGKGKLVYIEGIDQLYEFDKGAKSGWIYRVNGEIPGKSAGDYTLKAGDRVEWIYTLSNGKEEAKAAQ